MRILWAIVVPALALGGCQSKPIEQMSYSEVRALAGEITKRCHDQGLKSPGREFDACMSQEISREQSTRIANYQRRMAMADALQGAGASMQQGMSGAGTYTPPVNCTSRLGGTNVGQPTRIDTTCY